MGFICISSRTVYSFTYLYIRKACKIVSETIGVKEQILAIISRNPKETRIVEKGARGTREALLAGPASGCNRYTVRRITIDPDGCTARSSFDRPVVYFIHEGRVTLSHNDGDLDLLFPGDTVVVPADEIHHLHNIDKTKVKIVKVASQ